jgi:hypothetical protein
MSHFHPASIISLLLPLTLVRCADDVTYVASDTDESSSSTGDIAGTSEGDDFDTTGVDDSEGTTEDSPGASETSNTATTGSPPALPGCGHAEVLAETVTFGGEDSAAAMYDFCAAYPGQVSVDMLRVRESDAETLAGLSCICQAGILSIEDNPNLKTLADLDFHGGPYLMWINGNKQLVDLVGLEGFGGVRARIVEISGNAALTSLRGLDGIGAL